MAISGVAESRVYPRPMQQNPSTKAGQLHFSAPGEFLRNRDLPAPPWVWTDDTHMAVSIVETLQAHGRIQQDALLGGL